MKGCYSETAMKPTPITHFLLLATMLTLPFYEWRFFVLNVPIYMPELMVIFASTVFAWLVWHTDTFEVQKLPRSIIMAVAVMVLGLVSSALFNGVTSVQLGIIKSWFFFPMLFGWLVFQMSHQPSTRTTPGTRSSFPFTEKVLLAWYVTLVSTALVALAYFSHGDLTYDGRLRAFYLSPNYLALFLFPGIFLGWHFLITLGKEKRVALFLSAVFSWILLCAALYPTLSYTVIIASVLGFCIMAVRRYNNKPLNTIGAIAIGTLIIGTFLLFQTESQKFSDLVHLQNRSSLASRAMIWESAGKMIHDNPIVGIGAGNFQKTYLDYQKYFPPYLEWAVPHPHNLYLAFWLQTGILGLVGFLFLVASWLKQLLKSASLDTKKAPLLWTLFGIMVTTLLIGLLDTPYWKTDLAYSFWLIIALGL